MQLRRYEPYRLCFQLVAIALGIAYLATAPPPGSVAAVVGERTHWLVYAWSAGLLLSGAGAMVGSLWTGIGAGDMILGYAIERASLWLQSGVLFVIIAATAYVNGVRGFFGIAILLAWMVANVWRDRQIASVLTELRKVSELSGPRIEE